MKKKNCNIISVSRIFGDASLLNLLSKVYNLLSNIFQAIECDLLNIERNACHNIIVDVSEYSNNMRKSNSRCEEWNFDLSDVSDSCIHTSVPGWKHHDDRYVSQSTYHKKPVPRFCRTMSIMYAVWTLVWGHGSRAAGLLLPAQHPGIELDPLSPPIPMTFCSIRIILHWFIQNARRGEHRFRFNTSLEGVCDFKRSCWIKRKSEIERCAIE